MIVGSWLKTTGSALTAATILSLQANLLPAESSTICGLGCGLGSMAYPWFGSRGASFLTAPRHCESRSDTRLTAEPSPQSLEGLLVSGQSDPGLFGSLGTPTFLSGLFHHRG